MSCGNFEFAPEIPGIHKNAPPRDSHVDVHVRSALALSHTHTPPHGHPALSTSLTTPPSPSPSLLGSSLPLDHQHCSIAHTKRASIRASAAMSYTPTSYYGHSVKDRTSEFHGLVESIASRSSQPPAKQKLLNNAQASSSKGEFARRAQAIGKDIASTTAKLQRLAQCAFPLETQPPPPLETTLTFTPFALDFD